MVRLISVSAGQRGTFCEGRGRVYGPAAPTPSPLRHLILAVLREAGRPLTSLEIVEALDSIDAAAVRGRLATLVRSGRVLRLDPEEEPPAPRRPCKNWYLRRPCRRHRRYALAPNRA